MQWRPQSLDHRPFTRASFLRASVSSPTLYSPSCSWSSSGSTLASECQPDPTTDTWAMLGHCAELPGSVGGEQTPLLGLGPCRLVAPTLGLARPPYPAWARAYFSGLCPFHRPTGLEPALHVRRLSPLGFCPVFPPHDSLRRRGLAQTGIAVSTSLAALPVKQEEADHFLLPAGPLFIEQRPPRTYMVWRV